MPGLVVVGAQWGDEGKGKVTDLLAERADVVIRYQGGNNAGHTIIRENETYKLHLIPSGILYPGKLCVIGNGVVVDPKVVTDEIVALQRRHVDVSGLRISANALRSVEHRGGLDAFLAKASNDELSQNARTIKREIEKKTAAAAA